jgi:cell division protein FtsN
MNAHRRFAPLTAPLLLLLLSACGGSMQIEEDPYARPPDSTARVQTSPTQFETMTDTVATVGTLQRFDPPSIVPAAAGEHFTIQVGAYKDPRNASQVQALARERHNLPVLNDYDPGRGLYQIRLGLFESREAAEGVLREMKAAWPQEYRDAWIVGLKP